MVAQRILTEIEILVTGLNDVGLPFKGQVRTQKMIKLLHFPSFFDTEPPAIYALFEDLCEKYPRIIIQ